MIEQALTLRRRFKWVCAFLSPWLIGCHASETLWSTSVSSPDGTRVALAQTSNTDTIGNIEYTTVRIKHAHSWRAPVDLVVFDGGIDEQQDFIMTWSSPTHLDIVVKGYSPAPAPYRTALHPEVDLSVSYIQKPRPH